MLSLSYDKLLIIDIIQNEFCTFLHYRSTTLNGFVCFFLLLIIVSDVPTESKMEVAKRSWNEAEILVIRSHGFPQKIQIQKKMKIKP